MATPLPPEVLPPDYEALGSIGGLLTPREDYIPNLQSVYGDIVQNAADYQYFTAPLSNQGRATASYGTGNNLVVAPDTPVRLVNNATGEVVYSGVGYEGAQAAIDAANALSASTGKKANWDIQVAGPTMQGFQSVSTDRPDVSGLGIVADVALPVIGSVLAGPLGAAAGSGLSSAAQGRSLEDSLLRAALAGGTSYLGGELFGAPSGASDAAISANVNNAISQAYQSAQQGALSALSPIYGAAAGNLSGSLASGALSSLPSNLAAIDASSQAYLSNAGLNTGSMAGLGLDQFGNVIDETGAIVATAGGSSSVLPTVGVLAGVGGAATLASGAGGGVGGATDAAITQNTQNAVDTAYSNAQTGAASDLTAAGYSGMGAGPFVAGATGAGAGGVLGTGLTAGQLATIGGLGASAIGSLLGGSGSGGTGTGTPYVSPFGAGPAIGGADFRVNPNIQDYERYGFGGEATFFRPEYNKLVASGSMMGYTPPASTAPVTTTTPTYTPLIGGTTTGGTATTGGATTGGTTAITKQERPAGFTGVVSGQQVGDTQVVDGTTWSYGGEDAGWQMQYTDPTTGNLALLPGNGATNVSSFANNPTVEVNQPYFAQNTANIPGWAETYQGFQRGLMSQGVTGDAKAAAERELFSAIETQPFANPQALVDYARTVYNKYTTPGLI